MKNLFFGDLQVNIIRIYQQLRYFKQYQQRLSQIIGHDESKRMVKESLVLITLGGNDFVNNYYLVPYSVRSQQYSLQDYVPFVISEYKKVLQVKSTTKTLINLQRNSLSGVQ